MSPDSISKKAFSKLSLSMFFITKTNLSNY